MRAPLRSQWKTRLRQAFAKKCEEVYETSLAIDVSGEFDG